MPKILGVHTESLDTIKNYGIGFNQTWQNLTISRALGITYTNTTGKPIFVSVLCLSPNAATARIKATINGSGTVEGSDAGGATGSTSVSFLVPVGGTYNVDSALGGMTLNRWYELR